MKISVITPYYEGEKYIKDYAQCMCDNAKILALHGHELQVILVNDSPWEKINVPSYLECEIVENGENVGIHQSRVNGLAKADGEYIMFLDQDDEIDGDALYVMAKAIDSEGKPEVLVGNAVLQQSDKSEVLWYRNDYHKSLVGDLKTYVTVGIQIISPGQCLVKKEAIPKFWCENIVGSNGADDYFLWLLMLSDKARFAYLDEPLYTHKYTEKNLSADTTVTDASVYEFMEYLGDYESFAQKDLFTLHEMITYKNQFRASSKIGKAACSLANLGLFIENIKFKLKTGTGYGFNR